MRRREPLRTIVGLDVGSSVITTLIAAVEADGGLAFVAGAETPSRGVRGGVIANVEAATAAIAAALDHIEDISGQRVGAAYLSLGGAHQGSRNAVGYAPLYAQDDVAGQPGHFGARRGRAHAEPPQAPTAAREVTRANIAQAIAAARLTIPADERRETLHVIPRAYAVDDVVGVRNPLGMVGFELGVEIHVVSGAGGACQNLIKCARGARIEPVDLVAGPVAASEGILGPLASRSEALTVAIADIGAETTDLALYADGTLWRSLTLPVGAASVTRDIASDLRLPFEVAEALKRQYGHADARQIAEDDLIELQPLTGRDELTPRRLLAEIVEARVRELADALREPLLAAHRADVWPETLLLTGGGAQLSGLADLLTDDLHIPTQVTLPQGVRGLPAELAQPGFAVATGLVVWSARQWRQRTATAPRSATRQTLLPQVSRFSRAVSSFWRRADGAAHA
ncbi:MAG TPA: cell division protein FtsA [Ktedonobacterales bacterium]|nr:cell division protein FtsA [Ktedonobacterales bacterium]